MLTPSLLKLIKPCSVFCFVLIFAFDKDPARIESSGQLTKLYFCKWFVLFVCFCIKEKINYNCFKLLTPFLLLRVSMCCIWISCHLDRRVKILAIFLRYCHIPTMHCFQWDILYRWLCEMLVTKPT